MNDSLLLNKSYLKIDKDLMGKARNFIGKHLGVFYILVVPNH